MATNPQLDPLVGQDQQEPGFNIKLTVQELNVVFGALQELPHRVVDGLLKGIMTQVQVQQQSFQQKN